MKEKRDSGRYHTDGRLGGCEWPVPTQMTRMAPTSADALSPASWRFLEIPSFMILVTRGCHFTGKSTILYFILRESGLALVYGFDSGTVPGTTHCQWVHVS